jgi:hypothetical protein
VGSEYYAERLLDALGVCHPQDLKRLEEIAWARGATVRDAPIRGAEARLSALGTRAVITVSTTIVNPRRRRFSIAHELGHWEMRYRRGGIAVCKSADLESHSVTKDTSTQETEANEFAGALLLPRRFVGDICREAEPTFKAVRQLADDFEVSLTATSLRLLSLTDEACAVVFSERGCIKWFQGSRGFDELEVFIPVGDELDPHSLAIRPFEGRNCPEQPKSVKASLWFAPGHYDCDATLVEHSVAVQDGVLTLLWVDDDIRES